MSDLDLLDAELIGFDPMDLVKSIPGVLTDTGKALQAQEAAKKAAEAAKKAPPAAPVPVVVQAQGISLGWKVGIGAAIVLGLGALLRSRG